MRFYFALTILLLSACPKKEPPPPRDVAVRGTKRASAPRAGSGRRRPPRDSGRPVKVNDWRGHAPGLESGTFKASKTSPIGDSTVHVVRVDPKRFRFKLLSAGKLKLSKNKTAPQWVKDHRLVGVINASMYRRDHKTSVFYMRAGSYVNNPNWRGRANAVFATGRTDTAAPEARIIDRTCEDKTALLKYDTLVQSYRMLSCAGSNSWSASSKIYSSACVGEDKAGRILLIHSRSPYSTHDLIAILLALPLDLKRLMYVEGGPEASLYVEQGGKPIVSRVGSYETGFWENDTNRTFWPLPNVIGFQKK